MVRHLEIHYSKQAVKFINSSDRPTRMRIKNGIEGLTLTPPIGDIKALQGFSDDRLRLRIGKYRIVYKYTVERTVDILNIIEIGSRGDIYK